MLQPPKEMQEINFKSTPRVRYHNAHPLVTVCMLAMVLNLTQKVRTLCLVDYFLVITMLLDESHQQNKLFDTGREGLANFSRGIRFIAKKPWKQRNDLKHKFLHILC